MWCYHMLSYCTSPVSYGYDRLVISVLVRSSSGLAGPSLTRSGIASRPINSLLLTSIKCHLPFAFLSLTFLSFRFQFFSRSTPAASPLPLRHGMLRPLLLHLDLPIMTSTDALSLPTTLNMSDYRFAPAAYDALSAIRHLRVRACRFSLSPSLSILISPLPMLPKLYCPPQYSSWGSICALNLYLQILCGSVSPGLCCLGPLILVRRRSAPKSRYRFNPDTSCRKLAQR